MAVSAPRTRPWMPGRVPVRLLLAGLVAALVVGGAAVATGVGPFARTPSTPTYQTAQVSQGSLQLTVSATGPVVNPASVPLSFPSAGKLAEVNVGVGQMVTTGQVLARLDTADLQLALEQARAGLKQQQANLASVSAGATPEQSALAQAQIDAAQLAVVNAQNSLRAAQASADATRAASEADVSSAQVSLASAQKSFADAQAQAAAAIHAD